MTPSFDGGRPVVRYRAEAIPSGAWCETTSTSCRIAGLPNLRSFSVVVTAFNESGSSLGSASSGPHIPVAPPVNEPFADVQAGSEIDVATRWLRANGVTTGRNGSDNYGPGELVNRAQMVGFLYRLVGQPEGVNESCGFIDELDIPQTFRKAACWAKDQGITTRTNFNPRGDVNRGQMAAFLWRLAGGPGDGTMSCGFLDESRIREEFRAGACWLKDKGITVANPYNGAGTVPRGQMALFLYRFAMVMTQPSPGGGQ
jgi:hypothetical protein